MFISISFLINPEKEGNNIQQIYVYVFHNTAVYAYCEWDLQ